MPWTNAIQQTSNFIHKEKRKIKTSEICKDIRQKFNAVQVKRGVYSVASE